MTKRPKISIILPFYNIPQNLFEKCLNSILKQKFEDYELLVIDDGSSIEYKNYLHNIVNLDSRIKLICKNNGGVSSARNIGINIAEGDYVAFIDGDDVVSSGYLYEAYYFILKTGADYVIGGTKTIHRELVLDLDKTLFDNKAEPSYDIYHIRDIPKLIPSLISTDEFILLENGGYISRGPVSRLLRTEIAKVVKFPEGIPLGEDVIWNQLVLKHTRSVTIVKSIWYYYVNNNMSASYKYRKDAIECIRKEMCMLWDIIDTNNKRIYKAFCNRLLEETSQRICRSYLTRAENNDNFLNKYLLFSKLKYSKPWSYMDSRFLYKNGTIKSIIRFFTFKTNLYYPLIYIKDRWFNRL